MALLNIKTHKKLLPLSIAVALGTFSANSFANSVQIDATTSYTVGAAAEAGSDSASLDTSITPAATNVDILSSANATANDGDIFYHTYGDTSGTFGARVSGTGTYAITSSISYVDTVMNTTGTAQDYTFDFNIVPGGLSVNGAPTAGQFASADYSINIFLDGNSIFNSAAALRIDTSGTSFTGDTTIGGAYAGGSTYNWGNYLGSLNLGTFAAGQSFTLSYNMTVNANGNITDTSGGCGIECGEGGGAGSTARSGDPFGINGGNSLSINATPTTSVPEASSLLLMGLGLAGLGATRRRKSKLN